MGVPILPTSAFGIKGLSYSAEPEQLFLIGLSWHHRKPGDRRPLPSWSWAGWTGPLYSDLLYSGYENFSSLDTVQVYIEDAKRNLLKFPTLDSPPHFLLGYQFNFIYIEAWTIQCSYSRILVDSLSFQQSFLPAYASSYEGLTLETEIKKLTFPDGRGNLLYA
jgi:hypothetical protein